MEARAVKRALRSTIPMLAGRRTFRVLDRLEATSGGRLPPGPLLAPVNREENSLAISSLTPEYLRKGQLVTAASSRTQRAA